MTDELSTQNRREVTEGWGKVLTKTFHTFHSTVRIVSIIKNVVVKTGHAS
jgi:hypothetical protein